MIPLTVKTASAFCPLKSDTSKRALCGLGIRVSRVSPYDCSSAAWAAPEAGKVVKGRRDLGGKVGEGDPVAGKRAAGRDQAG